MRIDHKARLFLLLALLGVPNNAFCIGTARIGGTLIDSEFRSGFWFYPEAELRFDSASEDMKWRAAAQIKLQNSQSASNPTIPAKLEASIVEAYFGRNSESLNGRAGRLPIRPISISFNEASRRFMKSQMVVDGFGLNYAPGNVEIGAFGGDRKSAGLHVATRVLGLEASAAYRFQDEKLVSFPQSSNSGRITDSLKKTVAHDAEIVIKVPGKSFQAESVFQLGREGPYSAVDVLDSARGDYILGSKDEVLPAEAADYRATGQLKYKLLEEENESDWAIFAIGSSTAPRYHHGSPEDRLFRESSPADMIFIGGYEKASSEFMAQICFLGQYSTSQKFRRFASRNSSGEPIFTRTRLGVTLVASFNF